MFLVRGVGVLIQILPSARLLHAYHFRLSFLFGPPLYLVSCSVSYLAFCFDSCLTSYPISSHY